jgi:hypothetical protein
MKPRFYYLSILMMLVVYSGFVMFGMKKESEINLQR